MDFVVDAIAIGNHVEATDAELLAEHGITGVLCLARDRMRAVPPAAWRRTAGRSWTGPTRGRTSRAR
jgi:hypothetical protein